MNRWTHLAFPALGLTAVFLATFLYGNWVAEDCQRRGYHELMFGPTINCDVVEASNPWVA